MTDATDFFIGYQPTPPRLGRFLIRLVLGLLLIAVAAAIVLAMSQRNPADDTASDGSPGSVTGTLILHPYPALITDAGTILLVSPGKHGFQVTLGGTSFTRGNLRMLEAESSTDERLPPRLYRGEIVDSKCHLGAMKPGDGKIHKACAALCLRGGIPPAFRPADAADTLYLLTNPAGAAITSNELDLLLPFVADQVEFCATSTETNGLPTLCVDLSSIRRLTP